MSLGLCVGACDCMTVHVVDSCMLAYREMWAVILDSNREGLSLLHGIDLLLGRTRRPLQCIRGPFCAYKDESSPHVLAEVQNMLFVTSNPPPLPAAFLCTTQLNITTNLYSPYFWTNGSEEANRYYDSPWAGSLSLLYKGY